ncbi:putative toxin-antitoxin system toxin component, PIN family [Lacihabitans soyangensis]|uniref:Toxin-antitoxin system toxin component, PIN family n=1 Tax=Lacihabitans soyangensis TaxID=869394 RepID=A0AAE3H2Q3_9BACT|nr:putative toxin-antitoxin system toxin component, PIN family [Lacihabitans soyangensis]MCP9763862.1 putative toxin-antitoxin system toxin component, PIN family [Lacihabitans soyangensis]
MSTTAFKVVIDTNIFITIIGKKSPFRWIFDAILDGKLILCVSNSILLEYREILERKNGVEVAENILNFLAVYPFVEKFDIHFNLDLIPEDKDDNKFTDCAFASGSILISNDNHFNALSQINFPKITRLTIDEFYQFWKFK